MREVIHSVNPYIGLYLYGVINSEIGNTNFTIYFKSPFFYFDIHHTAKAGWIQDQTEK